MKFDETWEELEVYDFSATAERNLTKIDRKQVQFVDFRAAPSTKMTALASEWLSHFRLLLCNWWTWRKQRPILSLCFRTGPSSKMAAWPPIGLHFLRLLLCNRGTDLDESWNEASNLRHLLSLYKCIVYPLLVLRITNIKSYKIYNVHDSG